MKRCKPPTDRKPCIIRSRFRRGTWEFSARLFRTLASYLLQIAMLGGYLARKHDPPPGNMVVWRGLTRLNDITFGISIGTRRQCG